MRAVKIAAGVALATLALPVGAHAAVPQLSSRAAIAVEPQSETVVFARNAAQKRKIASTTKMMTALVALERASLDDVMVTVPYNAGAAESVAGFKAGERVTVRDLVRALMITSANDAAMTLAVRTAGSESKFVDLMNQKARSLGLKNTSFANPVGLDDADNYSTATDLVKLAFEVRKNDFLRDLVNRPSVRITSGSHTRTFVNRNALVRNVPWVNGVKTGHTSSAGYVLVGSATRNGVTVLTAVLGAPSEAARDRDTLALMRDSLSKFQVVTAVRAEDRLTAVPLAFRGDKSVDGVAALTVRRTVQSPNSLQVAVADVPKVIDGPLRRGERIGTVVVLEDGRIVSRTPLVADEAVDAATFVDRLRTWLARPLTLLLLAIFAGSSVYVLRARRKAVRRRESRLATRDRN